MKTITGLETVQADDKKRKEERRRRRDEVAALLLLLMGRTTTVGVAFITDWFAGRITDTELRSKFKDHLSEAHSEASALGRFAAGGDGTIGLKDEMDGTIIAAEQDGFFKNFVQDLVNGRYETLNDEEERVLREEMVVRRIEAYSERLRGTVNAGVIATITATVLSTLVSVDWVLDPGVQKHCVDCVTLAAGSPWMIGSLKQVPGDGSTECGPFCHCELHYDGDIISF